MAKFVKGQSGNPKGRPPGTGKLQRLRKYAEQEVLAEQRLVIALQHLEAIERSRHKIIADYIDSAFDGTQ